MSLSTGDVLSAIAGAELAGSRAAVSYGEFFTDTRKPCRGGMFVAISGERYDGNRFLQEAADAGAAGAIIGSSAPEDTLLPEGLQCFRVADTLAALQDLAAWHRHLCTRVRVVGITGSNGKSTTKQLTLSVCSKAFTTQATAGNLNNHIGVPLTLLGLDPDTELMITEMAANHPGEIRCLASLARPVVSLITNIMPTHLEGFSSLEGILQAKLELFEQTGSQGTLIFNGDDELLRGAVGRFSQEKITFGLGHTNQVKPFEVILAGAARYSFTLRPGSRHIHLPVPGRHNIYNALAAAAVGRALGIADEEIAAGIEHASGLKMRMELKQIGPLTVLDDCYNANPASMDAAVRTVFEIEHPGPRVAVIGEMLELGPESDIFHENLARDLARGTEQGHKFDLVAFAGSRAGMMKEVYISEGGDSGKAIAAPDAPACWEALKNRLPGGGFLLVKGSRGIGLEYIVRKLEKENP